MREIFSNAFNLTKKNALVLIGVFLTLIIISMVFSFITSTFNAVPVVGFIVNIISLVFQLYFGVGMLKLGLSIVDGKEPEFSDIKPTWNEMIKYLISGLLLFIIFMVVFMLTIGVMGMLSVMKPGLSNLYIDVLKEDYIGKYSSQELIYAGLVFLLLIIPAALIYLRLQFANYLVVDKKLEAASAILHSFKMTKGYLFYILLVLISVLLLNILGLVMLFLGLLFTIPMSFVVILLLYRSLEQQYQQNIIDNSVQE